MVVFPNLFLCGLNPYKNERHPCMALLTVKVALQMSQHRLHCCWHAANEEICPPCGVLACLQRELGPYLTSRDQPYVHLTSMLLTPFCARITRGRLRSQARRAYISRTETKIYKNTELIKLEELASPGLRLDFARRLRSSTGLKTLLFTQGLLVSQS